MKFLFHLIFKTSSTSYYKTTELRKCIIKLRPCCVPCNVSFKSGISFIVDNLHGTGFYIGLITPSNVFRKFYA